MVREEKIAKMIGSRNVSIGIRPKRKKKAIFTKSKIRTIFFVVLVLLFFSMIYLWSGFKQIQIGYEISKLKKKEMHLKDINRKLRLEISVLKSPQRLERIAKERFGFKPPDPDQIIVLK